MNFTKLFAGTAIVATAAILASLAFSIGCTEAKPENYTVSVCNRYFESLYHVYMGTTILADTLPCDSTSQPAIVACGNQQFSAETASGLLLNAPVMLQGTQQQVRLYVNERGRVE